MKNIKKSKIFITGLLLVLALITVYNIIDNNRINIVEEEVVIENLPSEFEGFTIVQISDLHGKEFGKSQSKLTEKINSVDYDMIAITGDMKDVHDDNIKPFLDMLNNIKNKDNIFYIPGNTDLEYFENDIKNAGCNILTNVYEFRIKDKVIQIDKFNPTKIYNDDYNVRIGLSHYPMTLDDYNKEEYDLILSGHYHGGQIRIPFYGALFIPHVNKGKLFPSQDEVSGLKDYKLFKQYTSRGLGANFPLKILQFRLFNTPEINVIKLVSNKK